MIKPKRSRSLSSSVDEEQEEEEERLPSPINEMGTYKGIYSALSGKVKEQSTGMATLAEKLEALRDGRASPCGSSNLFTVVFTGTSGSGKTETVRFIKYALGMDRGYEHDGLYVEVNRESQAVPPDAEILAKTLNNSIECYSSRLAAHGTSPDKRVKRAVYPRYIFLCIDELDKLPVGFALEIAALFQCGHYTTSSGVSFRLPEHTRMLIVTTCNYGEEFIRQMQFRVDSEAMRSIMQEMLSSGLDSSVVKNIGQIIVFYPLKTDTLRSILMDRLEHYIQESSICKQFGEVSCATDVKNMLIDKVINLTEPGEGIRQGLGRLLENIGDFFGKALQELINKDSVIKKKAKGALVFTLREIDIKEFDEAIEEECREFLREIMQCLMSDPRSIASIDRHRSTRENINTLSMYIDDSHLLSSEFLGSSTYTQQQNNLFNQCQFNISPLKVARLEEENHELKETLEKVDNLVQKTKGASSFYKEVKGIVTESKKKNLIRYEGSSSFALVKTTPSGAYRNRVREMRDSDSSSHSSDDEKVEETYSSSSYSSSEEDPPRPITKHMRMMEKYKNVDLNNLKDVSIGSDVDEDSLEDRVMLSDHQNELDRLLKKRLFKEYKGKRFRCIGPCGQEKKPSAFNPTLYKGRRVTKIRFRKDCNYCRRHTK